VRSALLALLYLTNTQPLLLIRSVLQYSMSG
jgi:hypothetical protein